MKKILLILDPLDSLNLAKDTSIAIMREAAKRGYTLYVCRQRDLLLRNNTVKILAKKFEFATGDCWYKTAQAIEVLPTAFNAILMRKDPPFDNEYLYSTYCLELAVAQGAIVLNNPCAVRNWNEKLSITRFPQLSPEFLVTSSAKQIHAFLAKLKDIILKPLNGMGGASIFRLTMHDPNISVILETMTHHGQQTIMAQQYLPEIKKGDKRIILIAGEPLPYALARIPKQGETRGNLAAGGQGVAQRLSKRDLTIAKTIGKTLKTEGLNLVGLDVIGDYVTEINVTSPTGMVEIAAQTDCNPAAVFINALESIIA